MRVAATVAAAWLLLGVPATAAGIPEASRERAARLHGWRAALAAAERARDAGRWGEAERIYSGLVREARDAGDEGLLTARAIDGLADTCRGAERLEEARRLYAESAVMWERLLGPDQPRLATTLHHLGLVEWRLKRRDEASRHLSRALAIFESALGRASPEARNTRRLLDRVYEPAEAETTGTR